MNAVPALLRVYLVDDEPLALKRLAKLLDATHRVEIAGAATDPEEAVEFLNAHAIDLLFLDIQMPGLNGFELLARISPQPMVIFTTAHDEYALNAFKVNSIDYLLKPIEPAELNRALDKFERMRGAQAGADFQAHVKAAIERAVASFRPAGVAMPGRIASRAGETIQFVELAKVTHFQAEEKLTYAVTSAKKFAVDYTIADLEKKLDRAQFLRIHRSTLVNLAWINEVHSWFGGRLLLRLKGDKPVELTVARDRVRDLKQTLGL